MTRGKLEVHIVEGKAIKNTDVVGTGDPYVELWLDSESSKKHKTDARSGTSTPVWDKFFHYFINNNKELNIRLLDEDVGADEEIGVTKISLEDVYQNRYVDKWISMPDLKSGKSNGDVRVILEFWPTD